MNVETKERLLSCTMLITEPNRFVAEVHDRMPVILVTQAPLSMTQTRVRHVC